MDRRFQEGLAGILSVSPDSLTDDFELNDQNWDSLVLISAIALIDQTYGLTVPTAKLANCRSAGEAAALVESIRREKSR